MAGLVATADVQVDASPEQVWGALTDPDTVRRYMFGTTLESTWEPGAPITWSGVFEDKPYQDKGVVLEVVPERRIVVTHYSALSGQPDVPESYHTLTYELEPVDGGTHLSLSQDNNGSPEEAERAQGMWRSMLDGLKDVVEGNASA